MSPADKVIKLAFGDREQAFAELLKLRRELRRHARNGAASIVIDLYTREVARAYDALAPFSLDEAEQARADAAR